MKNMNKKILGNFLRVFISLGLLTVILWNMRKDMVGMKDYLFSANIFFISISILFCVLGTLIMALRLKVVFHGQHINLSLGKTWLLYWAGYFFNIFLPSSVGGDIVKAYYASDKTGKKMESYTSVFMDRFFGILGIMLVAILALLCYGIRLLPKTILITISVFVLMMSFVILVTWSRTVARFFSPLFVIFRILKLHHVEDKLRRFYQILHSYRGKRNVIINCVLLSILSQFTSAVSIFFIGKALHCDVGLVQYMILVPIVGAITTLPSINGVGIREWTFVFFFGRLMLKQQAIAIPIIWSTEAMLMSFIGGIVYMTHPDFKVKNINAGVKP